MFVSGTKLFSVTNETARKAFINCKKQIEKGNVQYFYSPLLLYQMNFIVNFAHLELNCDEGVAESHI